MVLNLQTEKGIQECETIKKSIFDNLEEIAQDTQGTLEEIYRFTKGKASLSFDDVSMRLHSYYPFYEINISKFAIGVEPKFKTVVNEVTIPRTWRITSRMLGPEKKKKIKEEEMERIRAFIPYDEHFSEYSKHGDSSLVGIARNIKKDEAVDDAKDFAYLCGRIKKLPSQMITYMQSTAKEVNASALPVSVKGIGLKCDNCGGPNQKLKLFCEYCGEPVYGALPEKK